VVVSFRKPYRIIWANCGFKGAVSDITIARSQFISKLAPHERVLADLGYIGEEKFGVGYRGRNLNAEQRRFNSNLNAKRSIIERVNQRLKIFAVVAIWNRKDLEIHQTLMLVICKITNIIFNEEPL
jgi:hypothetical protein